MRMVRCALTLPPLAVAMILALHGGPAAAQQPAAQLPYCPCGDVRPGACVPDPRCPPQSAPRERHNYGYSRPNARIAPPPPVAAAPPPPPSSAAAPSLAPRAPSSTLQDASSPILRPLGAPGPRARIKATGYDLLDRVGSEAPGYGLYSYAIMPQRSPRAAALLDVLFKDITPIGETGGTREQQNILYLPVHKDKGAEWMVFRQDPAQQDHLASSFLSTFYDSKMAQDILVHICTEPYDQTVADLCTGNFLSRGPFLFTYAQPASGTVPVEPPFLLVDLTHIDPGAFREVVDAFQAQVQREDISDNAKIKTLRLRLLNIVMLASANYDSVKTAVEKTVTPSGGGGAKK